MYWYNDEYCRIISSKVNNFISYKRFSEKYPILFRKRTTKNITACTIPGFIAPKNIISLQNLFNSIINSELPTNCNEIYLQYLGNELPNSLGDYSYKKSFRSLNNLKLKPCINELMKVAKYSTSSRIRSALNTESYKISSNYDNQFADLYYELAIKRNFSNTYKYSNNNLIELSNNDCVYCFSLYNSKNKYLGGCFVGDASNGFADYIISVADTKHSSSSRIMIMLTSIKLYDLGFHTLNLGGGVTEKENDGLSTFKDSLGGIKTPWYGLKIKI